MGIVVRTPPQSRADPAPGTTLPSCRAAQAEAGQRSVAKTCEAQSSRAALQVSARTRGFGSRGPGSHGQRAGAVKESLGWRGGAGRAGREEAAGGIRSCARARGAPGPRAAAPRARRPFARARAPAAGGGGPVQPAAPLLPSPSPSPSPVRVLGVIAASPLPPVIPFTSFPPAAGVLNIGKRGKH